MWWTPLLVTILPKRVRRGERIENLIKYRYVAALFEEGEWTQSYLPLSKKYKTVQILCTTLNWEQFPRQMERFEREMKDSREAASASARHMMQERRKKHAHQKTHAKTGEYVDSTVRANRKKVGK